MKVTNWKTTLGGALLALGPVLKTHGTAAWMFWLAEACQVIGALILGMAAKDSEWKKNAGGAQ